MSWCDISAASSAKVEKKKSCFPSFHVKNCLKCTFRPLLSSYSRFTSPHFINPRSTNTAFYQSKLFKSACTKTRNTETKPPEQKHRNRRNQRNTETKPPEPPKPPKHRNETSETTETAIKTWTKRSKQPTVLNSGRIIMNNNFSNSFLWFSCFSCSFITIFAVSQSTYEEWNQKIPLFFPLQLKLNCYPGMSHNVKRFPMSTQRPQTMAYPVTEGLQIPGNLKRLKWKQPRKQCKDQGNKQKYEATRWWLMNVNTFLNICISKR